MQLKQLKLQAPSWEWPFGVPQRGFWKVFTWSCILFFFLICKPRSFCMVILQDPVPSPTRAQSPQTLPLPLSLPPWSLVRKDEDWMSEMARVLDFEAGECLCSFLPQGDLVFYGSVNKGFSEELTRELSSKGWVFYFCSFLLYQGRCSMNGYKDCGWQAPSWKKAGLDWAPHSCWAQKGGELRGEEAEEKVQQFPWDLVWGLLSTLNLTVRTAKRVWWGVTWSD